MSWIGTLCMKRRYIMLER